MKSDKDERRLLLTKTRKINKKENRPKLKRRKTSKDVEPSKKVKLTDTSKGPTNLSPKTNKSSFAQAKEAVFKARDTQMPQNQEEDMGKTDEPPSVKADPNDWFKKPKRPPTPDPE
ncbi:hypothetical protein Tco_0809053 [Tanacetum coccineum]